MKMIAINKHSAKLKIRCLKMPNAPYLERKKEMQKLNDIIKLKYDLLE